MLSASRLRPRAKSDLLRCLVYQITSSIHHFMKQQLLLRPIVAFGFPLIMTLFPICQAAGQSENSNAASGVVTPTVFQAAGPNPESIQSTVDAFRAALGEPDNANNPGPLASGRREINWDGGGGVDITTTPICSALIGDAEIAS